MNYYLNYSTGLIDAVLIRNKTENYVTNQDRDGQQKPGKVYRDDVLEFNQYVGEKNGSLVKSIDECVYDFVQASALIPSTTKGIDYEKEYPSPFEANVNKALLLLKWISGIQSITQEYTVEVTNDMLDELGLDIRTKQLHTIFNLLFRRRNNEGGSLVKNLYEDGRAYVRVASREIRVENGPGRINLKMDIPYLETKIKEYHEKLQKEYEEKQQNLQDV